MFGLSQGPAVNRHEVTKRLFFSTIDHRFAPVADVMTVWAERDRPLEGLSVRRIVIIPGFVCLDRPLGATAVADTAMLSSLLIRLSPYPPTECSI